MTLGCAHHHSDVGIRICLPILFAIILYLSVIRQASFASAINIHLILLPFSSIFSHNTPTMSSATRPSYRLHSPSRHQPSSLLVITQWHIYFNPLLKHCAASVTGLYGRFARPCLPITLFAFWARRRLDDVAAGEVNATRDGYRVWVCERLPADDIDVERGHLKHPVIILEWLSVLMTRNRQEWNEAFKVDDAHSSGCFIQANHIN